MSFVLVYCNFLDDPEYIWTLYLCMCLWIGFLYSLAFILNTFAELKVKSRELERIVLEYKGNLQNYIDAVKEDTIMRFLAIPAKKGANLTLQNGLQRIFSAKNQFLHLRDSKAGVNDG